MQDIDDPKIGAVEASTVKKGDWKTGILALSDGTHHLPECSSSGDILAQTLLLHRRPLLDGPIPAYLSNAASHKSDCSLIRAPHELKADESPTPSCSAPAVDRALNAFEPQ